MSNRKIKAVLFDMDGVLIDSEPIHVAALQQVISEFGKSYTQEDNREFIGRTDYIVAKAMVERHSLNTTPESIVKAKEQKFAALVKERAQIMPGIKTTLEAGKKLALPMAVASSSRLFAIKLVIKQLDIESYFQTIASGEEVPNAKPEPDVFLLAAKRLNVSPENCLVIEDSFNGVKAAKAAGMTCIAIPCNDTKHQDHSAADAILSSMEELRLSDWIANKATY